jgi:transcriptional regulator of NAD metabolism
MSWLTLSRTVPTAIFTILASYALWESHAPYKKRQRLRQTVAFIFFVSRLPIDHRVIITRFLAISKPGEFLEIVMK